MAAVHFPRPILSLRRLHTSFQACSRVVVVCFTLKLLLIIVPLVASLYYSVLGIFVFGDMACKEQTGWQGRRISTTAIFDLSSIFRHLSVTLKRNRHNSSRKTKFACPISNHINLNFARRAKCAGPCGHSLYLLFKVVKRLK